jgi:hypothetical protein
MQQQIYRDAHYSSAIEAYQQGYIPVRGDKLLCSQSG